MNKKQELVEKLLVKLEQAEVKCKYAVLRRSELNTDLFTEDFDLSVEDYTVWESDFEEYPVEILERILQEEIPKGAYIRDIVNEWHNKGIFKMPVKLMFNDEGVPCLQLTYMRYLQFFDRCCFQVCSSMSGAGSISTSRWLSWDARDAMKSDKCNSLQWVVLLGLCCEAAAMFSEFQQTLQSNPEMIEEFIRQTEINCFGVDNPETFHIKDLVQCIDEESSGLCEDATYHLADIHDRNRKHENCIFGSVGITDDEVWVVIYQLSGNKRFTVKVPDVPDGIGITFGEIQYFLIIILLTLTNITLSMNGLDPFDRSVINYQHFEGDVLYGIYEIYNALYKKGYSGMPEKVECTLVKDVSLILNEDDIPVLRVCPEEYLQKKGNVFVVTRDFEGCQQVSKSLDMPVEFGQWYQESQDVFPGWFILNGLTCDACIDRNFQTVFCNSPEIIDEFISKVSWEFFGESIPDEYSIGNEIEWDADEVQDLDNRAVLYLCDPRKLKSTKEKVVFASIGILDDCLSLTMYYSECAEYRRVNLPEAEESWVKQLIKYCGIVMLLTSAGIYHSMQDIYPYDVGDIVYKSVSALKDSGALKCVRSMREIWDLISESKI